MLKEIIKWDIYEVQTNASSIVGVMFRGRIRKFCLKKNRNVLVENTQDIESSVRFAIPAGENPADINQYLHKIVPDVKVELIRENVPNPVLSKLKVNIEDGYEL